MDIHTFFFCLASVFLVEVEGGLGTHHFFSEEKNWTDAQTYCRKHHIDLSYVENQNDSERMQQASRGVSVPRAWIGLHQDPANSTLWKWSGGGNVTYTNWAPKQPDNPEGETKGTIFSSGEWNDLSESERLPFYCVNISGMSAEEKTWQDALEHCREKHSHLISIASETEGLLAKTAMQRSGLAEAVWIGLRFLADQWLWVDGKSMAYKAWNQRETNQQCPRVRRCGALTWSGLWDNFDCVDKRYFICG